MKLFKKNAIVTGGTMGFGAAIVEAYVEQGANVIFCSRNKRDGEKLLTQLRTSLRSGQELVYQKCDVSSRTEVSRLFASALKKGPQSDDLGQIHFTKHFFKLVLILTGFLAIPFASDFIRREIMYLSFILTPSLLLFMLSIFLFECYFFGQKK